MSRPEYFLGIDGGGTRTVAVAVDSRGRVLAKGRAGSLNFFGSGLGQARAELKRLIREMRSRLPRGAGLRRGVVGCAALFEEATPAEKRLVCRGVLPTSRVRLVSDCDTAWFGATCGEPGVVVIAGTGSIVLAGTGRTRMIRRGGWGHLLGDEGSGYWIAREAVRAAIAAEEGRGRTTGLGRWIKLYFRVRLLTELVPILYGAGFGKERLAGLAEFLAREGAMKDRLFRAICRQAGAELALQTAAAMRQAGSGRREWKVYPIGSVLENGLVRRAFVRRLRSSMTGAVVKRPVLSPASGAAAMAMRAGGIRLTSEIIANLSKGDA